MKKSKKSFIVSNNFPNFNKIRIIFIILIKLNFDPIVLDVLTVSGLILMLLNPFFLFFMQEPHLKQHIKFLFFTSPPGAERIMSQYLAKKNDSISY
ncbi:hypothetical protein CH369_17965 [Leptospira levettii]|nr:hypothetical protein CH369_17965 [Leptospira levettii]